MAENHQAGSLVKRQLHCPVDRTVSVERVSVGEEYWSGSLTDTVNYLTSTCTCAGEALMITSKIHEGSSDTEYLNGETGNNLVGV